MIPISVNLEDCDVIEANCTIDKEFIIVMGDERFYRAFGDNTFYALDYLIHEDDRREFTDYIFGKIQQDTILVRCKIKCEKYRWMLISKKITDNHSRMGYVDLRFRDVFVQDDRFSLYFNNVKKYRSMLTLIKERIFEYDPETGMFIIYFYLNGRSEIIEKDIFNEWQSRMIRLGFVEDGNLDIFNRMCDDIRNGADSFSATFQSTIMSKGGRRDTLNFRGETLVNGNSKSLVVGIISEIGGRMEQKTILYDNIINKDSSTGLLNKKAVTDDIIETIKEANLSGSQKRMYLIIFDIDDFKSVNDTYGHYFGDEVILSFAAELSKTIGERGITGRIGGDEFMTLLTDYEDFEEVKSMLKAVRNRLKVKLSEKKKDYVFSVSIGICEFPKDASSYEELFKIADGALYIAKEKGKDRYIIYKKDMHSKFIGDEMKKVGANKGTEFMKPIDKCDMAANFIIRVMNQGESCMIDVLKELMDKMNIHGISIFEGDDMRCTHSLGHYQGSIENAKYVLDEKYLKLFDEHGINIINNYVLLEADFPEVSAKYRQCNVCSALQIIIKKDNKIKAMIAFDTFGEQRRKWSHDDTSTVYMIVKAIADVKDR